MTDNTPRHSEHCELTREQVLAVLADGAAGLMIEGRTNCAKDLRQARAAVAALYDSDIEIAYEMNAWKSRLDNQQRTIEQLQVERNKLLQQRDGIAEVFDQLLDVEKRLDGTEPSDAEGGVMAGTNRTTSGAIGQP